VDVAGVAEPSTSSRNKKLYIPGLNDYPELRDEFFQTLVDEPNFRIFVLYFDRPEVMKWMPKREERRYGRMLQTLVSTVDLVPPKVQFFGITIDSQNAAKPTQEDGKLSAWNNDFVIKRYCSCYGLRGGHLIKSSRDSTRPQPRRAV